MKFAHIRDRIANNPGFRTLEEVRRAGYRIVKERDGERYFLAKPEELEPLLVRLGDIAEVRFGIKTGANEFFYLEPVGMTVKEVAKLAQKDPMAPVRVKNSAGWEGEIEAEFLRPVITSLKYVRTLRVDLRDLKRLLFVCHASKASLREKKKFLALRYIKWGESQGYNKRRTCASRLRWWDVGEHPLSHIIYSRRLGDRHLCPINSAALVSDTLYKIMTEYKEIVALTISSTLGRLLLESEGRELTGAITVVELYIPDLLRVFILTMSHFPGDL